MKDFMMIFIGPDYEELGLSPEELQDRMGKWFTWTGKLTEQGIMKSGEALYAKSKRVTGPDRIVSDGPFVESKELIGGYFIVSAGSMDDVVKISGDFPDYDLGSSVEIREVMKFDQ